MPDILAAAITAGLSGLATLCLIEILERSGPKEQVEQQEETSAKEAAQDIVHRLPVAIDLPLPVGEINISTTKYIRQRSVTEVYFSLDEADWHELEQSNAWKQFQQEFMEVQKGTES